MADFAEFVEATGYVTDAEQFGWSFVQVDVWQFDVVEGLTWRMPNGRDSAASNLPVTQVSFQDAQAYCQWAGGRLPSYQAYWRLSRQDQRPIVKAAPAIMPLKDVNMVGNVWEITSTTNEKGDIRLAGGSYLCQENTCNGTDPKRALFVDKTTGNSHIGFSMIK